MSIRLWIFFLWSRSTVECLLNVQGLDEGAVKSGVKTESFNLGRGDDLDITRIDLKPHEFWARPPEGPAKRTLRRSCACCFQVRIAVQ